MLYTRSNTAVTDYVNRTVQVEFVSGVQRQCFTIATSPDGRAELVEIFSVNISSTTDTSVVVVSPSSSVIEIVDDDGESRNDPCIL